MSVNWDALVIGPSQAIFGEKEKISYFPQAGSELQITGIFDRGYHKENFFGDGSVGVTTVSPSLGIQLSQFSSVPVQNDRLFIVSTNTMYTVREVRIDGHGGARLLLNKVSSL